MSKKSPNAADIMVGKRIRSRRLTLGKTQEWLADQCDLTFQQIQKYEKGTNRVGASRMLQIAKALNISASYFLGEGENAKAMSDETLTNFMADHTGHKLATVWPSVSPKVRSAMLNLATACAEA